VIDEAVRLWRLRWVRLSLAVLAFVAVTVVTYEVAHPRIFVGFASYDDEGYMLTALGSFLDHGHLYNDVFSQYGPFYYEAWGAVFSILGLPVDHESGRVVTSLAWVASSLGLGLATWRMTRSALLGLATQTMVFGGLVTLVNEPMHPGGIICLLLATIVGISCLVRDEASPYAMAALGGAVMALILVKVNVGGFALASLALACVVSYPVLARRRWIRPLVEVGFVAIPLLLIFSKVGESWARHYAVHVAAAALALVIALRARRPRERADEELWWLVGGLIAVGLTVCLAILAAGTTPAGLVKGVIEQPLRQSDAFSIPLGLTNGTYLLDFLAIAGALGYWYAERNRVGPPRPAVTALASAVGIAIGITMALSVIGRTPLLDQVVVPGYPLALLGFAWVALVGPTGPAEAPTAFPRLLLPALAVLQSLHAYPVAGSQVQWSAILLIPVGALCIANGVRGLAGTIEPGPERRVIAVIGAAVAVAALLVLANVQLRQPLNEARAAYNGSERLQLPGAEDVRVSPEEAETYRSVVAAIDENCSTFVMLPGMDSFYVWTEIDPPTLFNATGWPTLFDDETQERVIEEIRDIEGLCLLRNNPQAAGWGAVEGPLVDYLSKGFEPVATIGVYELLKRSGGGGSA
jgi:hypothetical protein